MENNKEKLGQEPAFPNVGFDKNGQFTHLEDEGHYGISKRFYAACAAMQGILSGINTSSKTSDDFVKACEDYNRKPQHVVAKMSYAFADELLKQENQ